MTPRHLTPSFSPRLRFALLALFTAALLVPLALAAQRLPADVELQAFQPSSDYELLVDGKPAPKAKLYFSQRAAAFLVMRVFDSPVLLRQRGGSVESVHIMKVAKQADGDIDLLQGAVLATLGRFKLEDEKISFTVEGKSVVMVPKPPLVGLHGAKEVLDHSPEYGVKAASYEPVADTLTSLRKQGRDVRVKVFFGSWCSVCKQYLPYGLKLDQSLGESKVHFQYYGLPTPPQAWADPEVTKLNVKGVPTAIVYVDGKEAGRISGTGWQRPEQTLDRIVRDAG